MNWINITEEKPALKELIVLTVDYKRIIRIIFWKKKKIVFGWLQEVTKTENGIEYKFYDQTNERFRRRSVTHWMTLPQSSE